MGLLLWTSRGANAPRITLRGAPGSDYGLVDYWIGAPLLPNGWAILGETSKIIVASRQRLRAIRLDGTGTQAALSLIGAPGEEVRFDAVHPASKKVPLKYFAKVTEKLDLEAEPAESVAHRTLFKMQNSIRERRDSVLNFGIDDSQAALLRKAADQHAINEASEEDGSDNSSDGEKDV